MKKLVAFSVNKKGGVSAFESRRSYSSMGFNAYLGRWFRVPVAQAREWIASGEAEQVPMYPEAKAMEGAS
jgi:hypothetical protein